MTSIIHFETFLLAGLLLNLTPGNDTIFILSHTLSQGKKAGIISALGITTGIIIHTALAAFGLSIIIAKSIYAFNIIKYAGAGYLLFMGIKMFIKRSSLNFNSPQDSEKVNLKKIYKDGVLTNVLNPKVAMFFIAFLPQFINPFYSNIALPFLLLGISFAITGSIWCFILVNFSSLIFYKLRNSQKISLYLNKICGLVLIGLGINIALAQRK